MFVEISRYSLGNQFDVSITNGKGKYKSILANFSSKFLDKNLVDTEKKVSVYKDENEKLAFKFNQENGCNFITTGRMSRKKFVSITSSKTNKKGRFRLKKINDEIIGEIFVIE